MIILKVVSAENQGTFSDYHDFDHGGGGGTPVLIIGVEWSNRLKNGFFRSHFYYGYVVHDVGSRLSKN